MTTESAQLVNIGQRLSANEARTTVHEKHFDRVDASLEKLTEVSISLKEIVRHQDHAIRSNKMELSGLGERMDRRRSEVESQFTSMKEEIATVKEKVDEKIDDLKTELKADIAALSTKIGDSTSFLEKYKWILMGAGFVIFFLLDKLPIVESLLKLASGG